MFVCNKLVLTFVAVALLLCACGKSEEEKRAELVECGSYLNTLGTQMPTDRSGFVSELDRETVKIDSQAGAKGASMVTLAERLAQQMDAARATARAQKGAELAMQHLQARDINAAVTFFRNCSATHADLTRG